MNTRIARRRIEMERQRLWGVCVVLALCSCSKTDRQFVGDTFGSGGTAGAGEAGPAPADAGGQGVDGGAALVDAPLGSGGNVELGSANAGTFGGGGTAAPDGGGGISGANGAGGMAASGGAFGAGEAGAMGGGAGAGGVGEINAAGGNAGRGGAGMSGTGTGAGSEGVDGAAHAGLEASTSPCGSCDTGVCDGSTCRLGQSCEELHSAHPSLPTGIYQLESVVVGGKRRVYCEMTEATGGWTLCLASRYTAEAQALFVSSYAAVLEPEDNPFGYFDFCPQTKTEYLTSLATLNASTYTLTVATLQLKNASPYSYTDSWVQHAQGIAAAPADAVWIRKPAYVDAAWTTDGLFRLEFWTYALYAADSAYKIYFRGHLQLRSSDNNIIGEMAAGCQYSGCADPRTWDDSSFTGSNDSWGHRNAAGIGVLHSYTGWQSGPDPQGTAVRMLIFYR